MSAPTPLTFTWEEIQEALRKKMTPEEVAEIAAFARALQASPNAQDQRLAVDMLKRLGLEAGGAA